MRHLARGLVFLVLLAGGCRGACRPCPPAPRCCAPAGARARPAPPPPEPPAASKPVVPPPVSPTPAEPTPAPEVPAPAAPEDPATVAARSAAIRAALPAPRETWRWERDLVFDGFRLGTVTIEAEPAALSDEPVWYVLERTVREAGEGRVVSESSCFLRPDLSLIRGETVLRAPAGTESFFFGRRDGRMEVTAQANGEEDSAQADVPADATMGLFPVLRLLEAAFAEGARTSWPLRLPTFDPRHAFGDGEGKPIPAGRADVELSLDSSAAAEAGHRAVAATARAGRRSTLLLDPESRAVTRVRGRFPHWDLVPAGSVTRRPDWFDRVGGTPRTAYQAMCNFGRGYHTADRELLESAFDWTTMRDHEVAAGNYPADATLERVKEDYLAEFLAQSKHRTLGDCDDLLTQVLVTSEITKQDDGSVSIATLPVYGGHTFHLAEREGRWRILRVD